MTDVVTRPRGERRAVRSLIVGTAALGVLGLPFAILFGEPYPWLIMPGFARAAGFDGHDVTLDTAVFEFRFADGGTAVVEPVELFAEADRSHHRRLTERFSPEAEMKYARDRIPTIIFPGHRLASRSGRVPTDDPELLAWFEERSRALFPARELESVTVRWLEQSFVVNGQTTETQTGSTLEFQP